MLERLKNPGTILAITSGVLLILTTNGLRVDNEAVMVTVKALCSIGILLGILNNPDTKGII